MQIRPEAEQKLRAGFQRRVDQQRDRYAVQLRTPGNRPPGLSAARWPGFSVRRLAEAYDPA